MATYKLDEVLASNTPTKTTYSLDEVIGTPKPTMSRTQRFLKGVRDPIDASAQLLANVLPQGVESAINQANNYLADRTGLVSRLPQGGINQQLSEQEAQYQAGRGSEANTFDAYRLGGNVLSPTNIAIAAKIPVGATAAQKALSAIGGGAAINVASQPVTEPNADFGTEKAKQAGIGAAGGYVGQKLASGVSRVISPQASTNPQVQMLRQAGVNPTIGQTLGGMANTAEQKLMSVPLLGDMIGGARRAANTGFERSVYNRTLEPIGLQLPKGLQGRDALNFAEQSLKQNYDDVLTRIGAITPDQQFNSKVSELTGLVNSKKMPDIGKQKFEYLLNKVNSSLDENGVMTSQAYKELESSLANDVKKLATSPDIYDNEVAQAGKQLVANLGDMLERQAGGAAKDLKNTNRAWANFKRVQRAAGSVGAQEGQFTPAQLQTAVKGLDRTKDKAAFARGDALMQDLSEAGKSVLGNTVPNSGTTDRLLFGGGALGSYLIDPSIPLGIAGSSLLYTAPAQRALTSAVASRPQLAQPVANFIGQNSKYLLPAFGAMGTGLLNQ